MKGDAIVPRKADFPLERASVSLVYENIGTGLCDSFEIKGSTLGFELRIFVGIATKDLHLEICSDPSTNLNLAAFRTIKSRRVQLTARSIPIIRHTWASKILKGAVQERSPGTKGCLQVEELQNQFWAKFENQAVQVEEFRTLIESGRS